MKRSHIKHALLKTESLAAIALLIIFIPILLTRAATCTSLPGDINCDNKVDIYDLSILLSNFGKTVVITPSPTPTPSPSPSPSPSPAPKNTIIVVDQRPEYEANYATLANANFNYTLRNVAFSKDDAVITRWDTQHKPYYFTAASSDFVVFQQKPMYQAQADADAVLARPDNKGLFLHEVVTYTANKGGWNWAAAAGAINWPLIDHWVMTAKAKGKKVVWNEPAEGWPSLVANATAKTYLAKWGNTVVPMFGTNFEVGSSRVDLQACKLEYSIVSPK